MLKPFSSPTYRKNTAVGVTGDECCLCGRQTAGKQGAIFVPVNHETGEFVTGEQAREMGGAVSLYPIGPECAKRWSREYKAESCRLRRSRGETIVYDRQPTR